MLVCLRECAGGSWGGASTKNDGSEGTQGMDNNDRRGLTELTGKTLGAGRWQTVKVLGVGRS